MNRQQHNLFRILTSVLPDFHQKMLCLSGELTSHANLLLNMLPFARPL